MNDLNIEQLFEKFWEAYPRKEKQEDALSAYEAFVKESPVFHDNMLTAIEELKSDDRYVFPDPATWLFIDFGRWVRGESCILRK